MIGGGPQLVPTMVKDQPLTMDKQWLWPRREERMD